MTDEITAFRRLVDEARVILPFTGAGISTECGIPDFRSADGLWTRFKPIHFSEFLKDTAQRAEAWRRFFAIRAVVEAATPGSGHHAIAAWHAAGKLQHVITQNIDGLHQQAGLPEEAVIELHGTGSYARCLDCGTRHELAWARGELERTGAGPLCTACGGLVKPATIAFGQNLDLAVLQQAREAVIACDLLIVMGSSLQVHPAASFPLLAKRLGAALVIINREETGYEHYADAVIRGSIADALAVIPPASGESSPG